MTPSDAQASFNQSANAVPRGVDLANLVLKLLPSKNGAVLRRLLMTAVSSFHLTFVTSLPMSTEYITVAAFLSLVGWYFMAMLMTLALSQNQPKIIFLI